MPAAPVAPTTTRSLASLGLSLVTINGVSAPPPLTLAAPLASDGHTLLAGDALLLVYTQLDRVSAQWLRALTQQTVVVRLGVAATGRWCAPFPATTIISGHFAVAGFGAFTLPLGRLPLPAVQGATSVNTQAFASGVVVRLTTLRDASLLPVRMPAQFY